MRVFHSCVVQVVDGVVGGHSGIFDEIVESFVLLSEGWCLVFCLITWQSHFLCRSCFDVKVADWKSAFGVNTVHKTADKFHLSSISEFNVAIAGLEFTRVLEVHSCCVRYEEMASHPCRVIAKYCIFSCTCRMVCSIALKLLLGFASCEIQVTSYAAPLIISLCLQQ